MALRPPPEGVRPSLRHVLALVMLEGALIGAAYGLVEGLLVWHAPALWGGGEDITRGHLVYFAARAIVYPLITSSLACVLALAAAIALGGRKDWPHEGVARASAVLALSLEVAVATFFERHRPAGLLLEAFAISLAVAAVVALARPNVARRLSFVLGIPTAIALLLLPGWIAGEVLTRRWGPLTRVLPLAVVLGVLAIALLVKRRYRFGSAAVGPERSRSRTRAVAGLACAWLVVLAGTWTRVDGAPENPLPTRESAGETRGPNLVIVVLDTVRADHLSLYGYERKTTPHLEQLASRSVVFDAAVAPGDMTLSSHASLFTGYYPRSHGAHFIGYGQWRPLDSSFTTLAERLRDHGWWTAGVAANHVFFGTGYGLEQGFASFDARPPFEYELFLPAGHAPWFTLAHGLHELLVASVPSRMPLRHYRCAEKVMEEGRELLDAAVGAGRPFFLFINLMDAHWPFNPPAPYNELFPGRDERFESDRWRFGMVDAVVKRETRGVSDEERAHMESQYDGAIAYMDAQVGELVADLERRGLLDDTLLIVTADHGEAFGEHGLVGHAVSVYDDQVHVPLLIRPPGGIAARREPLPASLVDVPRTVLTQLGIDPGAELGGRDLLGASPAQPTGCISESFPNLELGGARLNRMQRAFRSSTGWKLIRTSGRSDALYDLSTDPRELRDRADSAAPLAELSLAFDAWLRATPEAMSESAPEETDDGARLRSLGY